MPISANRPIVAVYPGSFDPVTLGHEDVVRRTLRFCDRLIVGVAENATQAKGHLFEVGERLELMAEVFGSRRSSLPRGRVLLPLLLAGAGGCFAGGRRERRRVALRAGALAPPAARAWVKVSRR